MPTVLSLCISDAHKELLLSNPGFISHCIDGLLLSVEVRPELSQPVRASVQRNYAEVFQQLALYEPGKLALISAADTVRPALEAVATGGGGLCENAVRTARTVLDLLRESAPLATTSGVGPGDGSGRDGRAHIMISYCWLYQDTVIRLAEALKARGYRVWLDVEQMSGSTVDAMAEAVEGAAVGREAVHHAPTHPPNRSSASHHTT